jgi:dTDP-4-dehydrorhamnose reductase
MNNRRILILGATGQLGSDLVRSLQDKSSCKVFALSHEKCDICDPDQIRKAFQEFQPDSVVNCTAYNLVDAAQSDINGAFELNSVAVASLAKLAQENNLYFVHFSTDFVFDGKSQRPYQEDDSVAPLNIYGLSKAAGEKAIRILNPNHCIIRTCGLYGFRNGKENYNFIEKILSQVKKGNPIKVKNDTWMNPTYARELARTTCDVLDKKLLGTYHGANTGKCTWFEFTKEILKNAGIEYPIEPVSSSPSNQTTPRPLFSVLDSTKLIKTGVTPLSSWQDALASYFQRRTDNANG